MFRRIGGALGLVNQHNQPNIPCAESYDTCGQFHNPNYNDDIEDESKTTRCNKTGFPGLGLFAGRTCGLNPDYLQQFEKLIEADSERKLDDLRPLYTDVFNLYAGLHKSDPTQLFESFPAMSALSEANKMTDDQFIFWIYFFSQLQNGLRINDQPRPDIDHKLGFTPEEMQQLSNLYSYIAFNSPQYTIDAIKRLVSERFAIRRLLDFFDDGDDERTGVRKTQEELFRVRREEVETGKVQEDINDEDQVEEEVPDLETPSDIEEKPEAEFAEAEANEEAEEEEEEEQDWATMPREQVAIQFGAILNTARKTRDADFLRKALERLRKSGYPLHGSGLYREAWALQRLLDKEPKAEFAEAEANEEAEEEEEEEQDWATMPREQVAIQFRAILNTARKTRDADFLRKAMERLRKSGYPLYGSGLFREAWTLQRLLDKEQEAEFAEAETNEDEEEEQNLIDGAEDIAQSLLHEDAQERKTTVAEIRQLMREKAQAESKLNSIVQRNGGVTTTEELKQQEVVDEIQNEIKDLNSGLVVHPTRRISSKTSAKKAASAKKEKPVAKGRRASPRLQRAVAQGQGRAREFDLLDFGQFPEVASTRKLPARRARPTKHVGFPRRRGSIEKIREFTSEDEEEEKEMEKGEEKEEEDEEEEDAREDADEQEEEEKVAAKGKGKGKGKAKAKTKGKGRGRPKRKAAISRSSTASTSRSPSRSSSRAKSPGRPRKSPRSPSKEKPAQSRKKSPGRPRKSPRSPSVVEEKATRQRKQSPGRPRKTAASRSSSSASRKEEAAETPKRGRPRKGTRAKKTTSSSSSSASRSRSRSRSSSKKGPKKIDISNFTVAEIKELLDEENVDWRVLGKGAKKSDYVVLYELS